jgi:hypothetical protein
MQKIIINILIMSFFDVVSNLSEKTNKDKSEDNKKKFQKAESMAFTTISSNMKDIILSDAKKGFKTANVYTWDFVADKDAPETIGKSKFNGVWIKDLFDKGNLYKLLSDFLNDGNSSSNTFRLFIRKYVNKDTSKTSYNLIVTWKPLDK